VDEIRDLLDAEKQLVKALPKMAKSAEDAELEEALREHLEQTKAIVAHAPTRAPSGLVLL
jgi:ferritin-like metal-binding protein YciE